MERVWMPPGGGAEIFSGVFGGTAQLVGVALWGPYGICGKAEGREGGRGGEKGLDAHEILRVEDLAPRALPSFAHVEYASLADGTKLIEVHATEPLYITGRTVRVYYAPPRNQPVTTPYYYHKLYIDDGEPSGIYSRALMKDATGRPLGSGFVEFSGIPQATEALSALDGHEIDETPATIARSISARAAGTRDVELAAQS
ncbi:hypothetical protein FIBSPDRAFT_1054547 [Athelia psychrophila]|uniref:RRM domain-containing protein n=1 Tax=Athelia psychrophila TaxID=1759441 RepID=A0A167V4Z8_9AGAM|nr:hypothetical protein FIBSPDRAFT_1054547 [Fibularhizoctonia sp. CBS 109695]